AAAVRAARRPDRPVAGRVRARVLHRPGDRGGGGARHTAARRGPGAVDPLASGGRGGRGAAARTAGCPALLGARRRGAKAARAAGRRGDHAGGGRRGRLGVAGDRGRILPGAARRGDTCRAVLTAAAPRRGRAGPAPAPAPSPAPPPRLAPLARTARGVWHVRE